MKGRYDVSLNVFVDELGITIGNDLLRCIHLPHNRMECDYLVDGGIFYTDTNKLTDDNDTLKIFEDNYGDHRTAIMLDVLYFSRRSENLMNYTQSFSIGKNDERFLDGLNEPFNTEMKLGASHNYCIRLFYTKKSLNPNNPLLVAINNNRFQFKMHVDRSNANIDNPNTQLSISKFNDDCSGMTTMMQYKDSDLVISPIMKNFINDGDFTGLMQILNVLYPDITKILNRET